MRLVGSRRVPEDLAVTRVDRHHVSIAGGQENLVLLDCDAANPAVAWRLIRTGPRLPDEVARLRIQRLHDVARAGQIDHAVVHNRRRLVGAGVVHRPHPLQLQVLHVVARDLIERAVALPLIIPAHDEPVFRGRIFQHGRRHRHVIPDVAGDGHAVPSRSAAESATCGCPGALHNRSRAASGRSPIVTPAAAAASAAASSGSLRVGCPTLTGGDGVDDGRRA